MPLFLKIQVATLSIKPWYSMPICFLSYLFGLFVLFLFFIDFIVLSFTSRVWSYPFETALSFRYYPFYCIDFVYEIVLVHWYAECSMYKTITRSYFLVMRMIRWCMDLFGSLELVYCIFLMRICRQISYC